MEFSSNSVKIRPIHNERLEIFYNPVPLNCLSLMNLSDTEGHELLGTVLWGNWRKGYVCLERKAYRYVSSLGAIYRDSMDMVT